MSRLSNRVRKLETGPGIVDMEQLQRDNPELDLSILSEKHLLRFAEMQRDTRPRSLAEFSNKELHSCMAFHVLFAAHAADDEAAKAKAIAVLDDEQEFSEEDLLAIADLRGRSHSKQGQRKHEQ